MPGPGRTRLHHLAPEAWTLERREFIARCGAAFLLRKATTAELEAQKRTAIISRTPLRPGTLPGADYLVYPLQPAGEGAAIHIGRSRKNDIVIVDPSISASHAIVQLVDGRWRVADAGSSNGTFVEEQPVRLRDSVPVEPGARLRLGAVNLTFLDAAELIRLVKRLIPFAR